MRGLWCSSCSTGSRVRLMLVLPFLAGLHSLEQHGKPFGLWATLRRRARPRLAVTLMLYSGA